MNKMKKMMMTLAIMASMFVMASTDVYTFKTSMKYPAIGKTAFVPKTTTVSGTLTISDADSTNATATLVVTVKGTKQTYTLTHLHWLYLEKRTLIVQHQLHLSMLMLHQMASLNSHSMVLVH